MNGMNLSGNPGIVHAMQMPPTFGQPPTPPTQPRIGTLHFATGPLQPSLTRHPRWSAGVAREHALLGEAGATAALLHGAPEQPARAAVLVDVDQRRRAGQVQREVQAASR